MDTPALSVIIPIGRMRDRAERSLKAVLAQKIHGGLEIFDVDTTPELERIDGSDAENVTYIEYPDAPSAARAKILALHRTSSELVAFVEDHAFVETGWAAGVLKGFDTGADVVIYTFKDATPETVYSRAFGLLAFGQWMSDKLAGERLHGPGNNVAYRKSALLRQGDRLIDLLPVELFLHRAVREQGGKVYQEASAGCLHAHWDNLMGTLWDTCMYSRLFAHQRRILDKPSKIKRLLYAGSMPMMPMLVFWRYCKGLKKDRELLHQFIRNSPLILCLSFGTSSSEAIGYLNASPRYRKQLETECHLPRGCD